MAKHPSERNGPIYLGLSDLDMLNNILVYVENIWVLLSDIYINELEQDAKTWFAVQWCFLNIGKNSSNIRTTIKDRYSDFPWLYYSTLNMDSGLIHISDLNGYAYGLFRKTKSRLENIIQLETGNALENKPLSHNSDYWSELICSQHTIYKPTTPPSKPKEKQFRNSESVWTVKKM